MNTMAIAKQSFDLSGRVVQSGIDIVEDHWAKGVAAVVIGLLSWQALTVQTLSVGFAEIRRELDLVAPGDVMAKLHQVESKMLQRDDVKAIMNESAPWLRVRDGWLDFRENTERRLQRLEEKNNP